MRVDAPLRDGQMMPNLADHYAPEILKAMDMLADVIYKKSTLPLRMFEAVRIATAIVNGCTFCQSWRTARDVPAFRGDAVGPGGPQPDETFYKALMAGDVTLLDHRERLAVRYAERMGTDPQGLARDENFWTEFKSALTDREIVEITYEVACFMGAGRATHVLGRDQYCSLPPLEPVGTR